MLDDLDALFVIAEASPMLDQVEENLRAQGKMALADDLLKLQQDTGIEINIMMGMDTEPAGPESARLRQAYVPLSPERLQVLPDVHAQLDDAPLQKELAALIRQMPLSNTPSAPKLRPHPPGQQA